MNSHTHTHTHTHVQSIYAHTDLRVDEPVGSVKLSCVIELFCRFLYVSSVLENLSCVCQRWDRESESVRVSVSVSVGVRVRVRVRVCIYLYVIGSHRVIGSKQQARATDLGLCHVELQHRRRVSNRCIDCGQSTNEIAGRIEHLSEETQRIHKRAWALGLRIRPAERAWLGTQSSDVSFRKRSQQRRLGGVATQLPHVAKHRCHALANVDAQILVKRSSQLVAFQEEQRQPLRRMRPEQKGTTTKAAF